MGVRHLNELRFSFGVFAHSAYALGSTQITTMRLDQDLPHKLIAPSMLSNCGAWPAVAMARKKLTGAPEIVKLWDWL